MIKKTHHVLDNVFVNGKPVKEHIKNEKENQKSREAKEEFLSSTTQHLYKKPTRSKTPVSIKEKQQVTKLSKVKIMQEQFNMDIKQLPIKKHKILAVLLKGEPVTTNQVVDFIFEKTGEKYNRDTISSLVSLINRGPLGEYINIKIGKSFTYEMEHPFKSTMEAIEWEKNRKKQLKSIKDEKYKNHKENNNNEKLPDEFVYEKPKYIPLTIENLIKLCLREDKSITIIIGGDNGKETT